MEMRNDTGLCPKVGETKNNEYMKQRLAFIIISMACFTIMGIGTVVGLVIAGGFTWFLYPILTVGFAWLLCTPLLIKSSSFTKWLLPPTIFTLPYLLLLGRIAPVPGWLVDFILSVTALSLVALWVCFFASKKLMYNSWYFSAALIAMIGSVVSPITLLVLANFIGVGLSLPDFISTLISLMAFISIVASLMVAGILFIFGYTKRNFHAETEQSPCLL